MSAGDKRVSTEALLALRAAAIKVALRLAAKRAERGEG
jgi:hypothetical protein